MGNNTDQLRLEFAATIFIRECLRQYIRLHPGTKPEDLPMGALCEYNPREQKALIAALSKAIEAHGGMNDTFNQFLQNKIDLAKAQSHPTSG